MSREANSAKHHVLVIDDEQINLEILNEILKDRYQTTLVQSSHEGILLAQERKPDLIILDVMMPEMDGYETCENIRKDPIFKDTPILFISALDDTESKIKAFKIGGNDYITKPFHQEEVLARVEVHLNLYRSYKELKELESMRDQLTHMLIHDLRAPLSAAESYLGLYLDTLDNAQAAPRHLLEMARYSTTYLNDMITSVLDVNRYEANKMPVNFTHFDLCPLIYDILAMSESICKQTEVRLHNNLCTSPMMIWADAKLVKRIFINLVTNAIRYSPHQGKIHLYQDFANELLRFNIVDSGPGVPQESQEQIFEKYGQIGSKSTYTSGLGLTFCKLAVESMGGSIGLSSESGKGCHFWFTLKAKEQTS
ncbi:MAG: hybrid sensor histidine kinase/response regulator [Planctomycetes bacterium]|nr:hybrid sensor histidine kinase/response regulator [Planctomycetota bacterium]